MSLRGYARTFGAKALAGVGGFVLATSVAAGFTLQAGGPTWWAVFCAFCSLGAVALCLIPYVTLWGIVHGGVQGDAVVTSVPHRTGDPPVVEGRARLVGSTGRSERTFRTEVRWALELRPGACIRVLARPEPSKLYALGPSERGAG